MLLDGKHKMPGDRHKLPGDRHKMTGDSTKWRGTAQNDGGHRHSAVKTSHITYYGIVNFESYEVFIGGMYTYTYAFPKFLTVITATTLDICHVKYSLTLIGEKYFNIQLVITIYGTILHIHLVAKIWTKRAKINTIGRILMFKVSKRPYWSLLHVERI